LGWFRLIWDEQGHVLILFTEWFHLNPHELIYQDKFSFWEKNWFFTQDLKFTLIGKVLGDYLLEIAHHLPCDHLVQISWKLVLIWPKIVWFWIFGSYFREHRVTPSVLPRVSAPKRVLSIVFRCLACVIVHRIILLNSKWLTEMLNGSCRVDRVVSLKVQKWILFSITIIEHGCNTLIRIEVLAL
jgi:hypothetical protein